jgi:hypothetical protein
MKKIKRKIPVPKIERLRMGKKEIREEYVRPIKYLARKRSPRIVLHRRKKPKR